MLISTRSIPACAGETGTWRPDPISDAVYPRVCGGNSVPPSLSPVKEGLSPRVRGKRKQAEYVLKKEGSIPACAGETSLGRRCCCGMTVYPRVCGGNGTEIMGPMENPGLSPRVRGKRRQGAQRQDGTRSIPACAGETRADPLHQLPARVYPRVCGGNRQPSGQIRSTSGLSPRVRGKPLTGFAFVVAVGSIPACAGETVNGCAMFGMIRVYPRVCGGNSGKSYCKGCAMGLSPRVRGKLPAAISGFMAERSIPACAGETHNSVRPVISAKVYPRVCGGNPAKHGAGWTHEGLSPRVRGKPAAAPISANPAGSIPACAGETGATAGAAACSKVYPRVCGGNAHSLTFGFSKNGLSPRVRGKQTRPQALPPPTGSIPACAGETSPRSTKPHTSLVYPRVCGGNGAFRLFRGASGGLSPRVRGKPGGAD